MSHHFVNAQKRNFGQPINHFGAIAYKIVLPFVKPIPQYYAVVSSSFQAEVGRLQQIAALSGDAARGRVPDGGLSFGKWGKNAFHVRWVLDFSLYLHIHLNSFMHIYIEYVWTNPLLSLVQYLLLLKVRSVLSDIFLIHQKFCFHVSLLLQLHPYLCW